MLHTSVTAGDASEYQETSFRRPVAWHDRTVLLFFFGMTLFQVWICATNGAPMFAQSIDTAWLRMLHTGGILTTLLLCVLFRQRLAALITGVSYSVVVAVAAVCGTIISQSAYFFGSLPAAMVVIGTLLMSCSTGALLALWGEGYARMPARSLQAKATLAAVASCFAIYLLISALPQLLSFALVSAFPLLAVVCLRKLMHSDTAAVPDSAGTQAESSAPFATGWLDGLPDRALLRLMLYIVLCSIPMNFLNTFFTSQVGSAAQEGWPTVYSVTLLVFVGAICLESALFKTGRSALPVLIGVLVTAGLPLYFFLGAQTLVVRVFMGCGYYLFVAVFYSYLGAETLAGRRAPFLVFAFGNCANTVGLVLGWALGFLAGSFPLPLASPIAVGIVYVVLLAGLFLLSSRSNAFQDASVSDAVRSADGPASANALSAEAPAASLFVTAILMQCAKASVAYGLSPREEEILGYLVRGRSVVAVAEEMNLSRNTVKTHVEHMYRKLDVHTREELLHAVESVGE
jgi:DNA-binding CsgD family transcriptional regulator